MEKVKSEEIQQAIPSSFYNSSCRARKEATVWLTNFQNREITEAKGLKNALILQMEFPV